ncbi:MAG: hypothetical protein HFH87_13250, partial [Lachnospiraceae bacterium]|nr:hypothetical protein [Lachnospiraceae bacterium]
MEDKKIVIYGSGRYPKDFLYVFDHIQAAYFVDEQAHDDVRSFWELQKEAGEIFVIICKYDDREARKNLEKIGLKKGSGYAAAADLFWKLDFPIREIAEKRDIYVWGTGDVSHDFFHTFVESHPDVEIVGCVDSNPDKSGKTFFRRTIYIPDEVLEGRDNFYIIASTLYYGEIRNILLAHGKQEGKDFISSRAIHQRASWMMRETVYDVPKLDYVCPKAFQDVVLREEGTLSVCSGIRNVDQWNTPLFYSEFDRVWHSNIMKILRLSMLNGTYSFCDPQKCDLLQNCGKRNIDTDELHYCFHRTKMQIEYIAEKETLPKETIFTPLPIRSSDLPEADGPPFASAWSCFG